MSLIAEHFSDFQLLVALTASNDEEVQSIACYDLGEFVRHYPNGRAIARSLGAKDIVMKLVDHPNKELQRHALTAISKMMVMNWAVRIPLEISMSLSEPNLNISLQAVN